MNGARKMAFYMANIGIPLLIGAVIYMFLGDDVIFLKALYSWTGTYFGSNPADSVIRMVIRYYLPDILWAYALFFALDLSVDNNAAGLRGISVIAFVFSAIMEVLQLLPVVPGTFDIADIVLEAVAELVAAVIIKNFYEEAGNIC